MSNKVKPIEVAKCLTLLGKMIELIRACNTYYKSMHNKFLPLIISTFAFVAFFQSLKSQRAEPLKRDNVIVITADTNTSKNLDDFGKHLIDNGYTFTTIDRNFKIITTDERVSKGGYKHKLNVSFKDSTIIIRATCNMMLLGSSIGNYQTTWVDWKYYRSHSNIYNLHYRAFMPIISSFNKPILYYLRP